MNDKLCIGIWKCHTFTRITHTHNLRRPFFGWLAAVVVMVVAVALVTAFSVHQKLCRITTQLETYVIYRHDTHTMSRRWLLLLALELIHLLFDFDLCKMQISSNVPWHILINIRFVFILCFSRFFSSLSLSFLPMLLFSYLVQMPSGTCGSAILCDKRRSPSQIHITCMYDVKIYFRMFLWSPVNFKSQTKKVKEIHLTH